MSFKSQESAVVNVPCQACFDLLSDAALFVEFMGLSDITTNVNILSINQVLLSTSLDLIELEARGADHESFETCTRINFTLTENVTYLGIAKEIPVVGYLVISNEKKLHVEHREASAGLVITDKIRRFDTISSVTDAESTMLKLNGRDAENTENEQGRLQSLVNKDEVNGRCMTTIGTSIVEEITGSTSWYLKFFVELEAQVSHKRIVRRYAEYLTKKHAA